MAYQEEFIATVVPLVQKYAIKYGYRIASAIIGQACLESGYGTTGKARYHNNLFGLKYRPDRATTNNGYFADGGSEQNPNGTWTPLPNDTLWYHFDNYEACVEAYFQFINIPRYANLKTSTTPLMYLTNIRADGYATDLNYVQKVSNIIAKYNLIQYDTLKIDPEIKPAKEDLNIIKQTSTANTTVCQGRKIDYIALHYTASVNSKVGTARGIASYFSNTSTKASADFIVDEKEIVQYNPDIINRYCWAVGGKKYSSTSTSQGGILYGIATNKNCISIELCSKKMNPATKNATDVDWYFEESVINNGVILTQYLMKKYHIDINHVIMHHHVTGKICPNPWCVGENRLQQWRMFLQLVQGGITIPAPHIVQEVEGMEYVNKIVKIEDSNTIIYNAPYGDPIGKRTGKGTFTIIKKKDNWGLLKSGAGWINLAAAGINSESATNNPSPNAAIQVRVLVPNLNIRKSPNGELTGRYTGLGIFTIEEVQNNWGLLKAYQKNKDGWIYLGNPKYVQILK